VDLTGLDPRTWRDSIRGTGEIRSVDPTGPDPWTRRDLTGLDPWPWRS